LIETLDYQVSYNFDGGSGIARHLQRYAHSVCSTHPQVCLRRRHLARLESTGIFSVLRRYRWV